MKFLFKNVLFAAAALLVASCSSESVIETADQQNDVPQNGIGVSVYAPAFTLGSQSRSAVSSDGTFSWTAGDKVGIYSYKNGETVQNQSQLALTLSAGEGESTAYTTATGWSLMPGGTYQYFSYYRYSKSNSREKIVLDYTGQVQTANNSTAGLGNYDYMYADPVTPTSANTANFSFHHIGSMVNVKITVPETYKERTFSEVTLSAGSALFCSTASYSVESVITNDDHTPSLTATMSNYITVSFGETGITPDADGVISVWLMTLPAEWKDQTITVELPIGEKDIVGTFTPRENLSAGSKYEYSSTNNIVKAHNLPAKPADGETLHVLLFGHSFGIDCTEYLPAITKAAGVTNVHYGRFYQGNCSIATHLSHFQNNTTDSYTYYDSPAGSTGWTSSTHTSKDILEAYPWDIIIFQTNINHTGEGNYDSYKANFKTFREGVIKVCQDKHGKTPRIGWNMFWGYNDDKSTAKDLQGQTTKGATEEYNLIVSATQAMSEDTGIKIIIPTGTTIQNCRNALDSNWRTESTMQCLTRDGCHTTLGIGRYATACTWFQYLIAPIYDVSITGNTYRPTSNSGTWDVVTDTNVNTIWECVKAACQSPFAPTAVE